MNSVKERLAVSERRPAWLKKRLVAGYYQSHVSEILDDLKLHTVCQGALCPNIGECFKKGTATFMILGDTCTRNCRFCAVIGGEPMPVDKDEPRRLAAAVRELDLKYVVITSVTRDDLPDGGAGHFASTVAELRRETPEAIIEILTPDFQGHEAALQTIASSQPDVFNHNVETVPRLYPTVRPMADYGRSLRVLKKIKELNSEIYTKSGIMVGLGEKRSEISEVLSDLRDADCSILTVGQYLRPSKAHLEIQEYIHPDVFLEIKEEAEELGFIYVASAPFVRSSFNAAEAFDLIENGGHGERR